MIKLSTFWERIIDIVEDICTNFVDAFDDFFVVPLKDMVSSSMVGDIFGQKVIDFIFETLNLEDVTVVGVLFGVLGLYIIYQLCKWIADIVL